MGYFEDSLENTTEIAIFIEIKLSGWPLLHKLNDQEIQALYAALTDTLIRLKCPSQAMKVIRDRLVILLQLNPNCSMDKVEKALLAAAHTSFAGRSDYAEPKRTYMSTMSPQHVIDAVVRLRRPA